jgi:hypothetical protein
MRQGRPLRTGITGLTRGMSYKSPSPVNIFYTSNQDQDGLMTIVTAEGRGNGGVTLSIRLQMRCRN